MAENTPLEPENGNSFVGKAVTRSVVSLHISICRFLFPFSPCMPGGYFAKEFFIMTNEKPKSNEVRMWLLILASFLILVGIGLVIFLAAPAGEDGPATFAGYFSKLFENPWPTALAFVLLLAGIAGVIVYAKKGSLSKTQWETKEIITAALCMGLSFVLSCIKLYEMPLGGSITPGSMLPIILFAYIYGTPKGLIVGLLYGFMQMLQGIYFVDVIQFALDYILAFLALGLAGLYRKNIVPAVLIACAARFFFAFWAGMYWIPEGQNPFIYSFVYNITYIGPECVICVLISLIPGVRKNIEMLKNQALQRKNAKTAKAAV